MIFNVGELSSEVQQSVVQELIRSTPTETFSRAQIEPSGKPLNVIVGVIFETPTFGHKLANQSVGVLAIVANSVDINPSIKPRTGLTSENALFKPLYPNEFIA